MSSNTNGDIIHRLRTWVHAVDAAPVSDLMDEAAEEIEALRREIESLRARALVMPNQDRPRPDGSW